MNIFTIITFNRYDSTTLSKKEACTYSEWSCIS